MSFMMASVHTGQADWRHWVWTFHTKGVAWTHGQNTSLAPMELSKVTQCYWPMLWELSRHLYRNIPAYALSSSGYFTNAIWRIWVQRAHDCLGLPGNFDTRAIAALSAVYDAGFRIRINSWLSPFSISFRRPIEITGWVYQLHDTYRETKLQK